MQVIGYDAGALGLKIMWRESVYRGAKEITLRVRRIEKQNYQTLL